MLNRLEGNDLLPKLLPFPGISDRLIEGPLRQSNPLGPHPGPGPIEGPHGDDEPHPFLPDQVLFGNKAVLEDQFPRCGGTDPHLLLFLPEIETRSRPFRQSKALAPRGPFDRSVIAMTE